MTACSAFGSMIQANLKNGWTFCDGIPKCQPGTVLMLVCVCVQMRSFRLEPSGDQVMCVKYKKIRAHVSYLSEFYIFGSLYLSVCELSCLSLAWFMCLFKFELTKGNVCTCTFNPYSLRSFYSIRVFFCSVASMRRFKKNIDVHNIPPFHRIP